MKVIYRFFSAVFLLIGVTPLYAQFQTIQKKSEAIHVYTPDELKEGTIFNEHSVLSVQSGKKERIEVPVPDSVAVRQTAHPWLSLPLSQDTLILTSPYGYRADPINGRRKFHAGTDYRASSDRVLAMLPGRIQKVDSDKRLGNYIVIEHGEFTVTYGHLYVAIGHEGDFVEAGQAVGISGSTGRSTGEHLHLSMRYKGKTIDPHPVVRYIEEVKRGRK